MKLFDDEENFYLPKEYIGETTKNGGLTINDPRRWTEKEIEWALMLKDKGFTIKDIAKYLYRQPTGVSIKLKRLSKKDGKTYNEPHRDDKYHYNDLFLKEINPTTVLDLYSGKESFYKDKVAKLTTNDLNADFNADYCEKAEKLVCKLYYENKKYDLIDIDPFGSGYECFDLSIKMAKKGLAITLGELGHKRWGRLDFVRRHYGIDKMDDFTSDNIIEEIIKIGERNKKKLVPFFKRDYRNIARVYFIIENIKITEQWE